MMNLYEIGMKSWDVNALARVVNYKAWYPLQRGVLFQSREIILDT